MENRKYKSWTTKELNDLVALHVAGHSSEKIAQKMERTTNAINAKKEQLRASGRIESGIKHWTNKQVKTAIEMHNIGCPHQAIGDPKWLQAMKAISDSIIVTDSKDYIRFYERDTENKYQAISLDFANV